MRFLLLLLILPFNIACAQQHDLKKKSEQVFKDLRDKKYLKVHALFDSTFGRRTDTTKLRRIWENMDVFAGAYKSTMEITEEKKDSIHIVIQHCQFVKKKIDLKIVYDKKERIRQLSFLPAEKRQAYVSPPYFKPEAIREYDTAVQNKIYRLPGTLTLPAKPGRYPVVILVHGAGANDRDETVGPMKIFKDLAVGLAAKGVGVFRYEKRTKAYRGRMIRNYRFTVEEETIQDAVLAVKLMSTDKNVDTNAIYVCGHSLGGMLLPRIAEASQVKIKGLIYLCANARPLEDVIYAQAQYLASLDSSGKDNSKMLDSLKLEVRGIKSIKDSDPDSTFFMKIPVPYWRDLNKYDPLKKAASLKNSMLFLHGGRDYQVSEVDFNMWKEAMKGKDATFKFYPSLNHFFVKGTGKSTPSEYEKPGYVDMEVINDISNWILQGKK